METTTLELPIDLSHTLDEIAERRGTSRARLIEEMVRTFVIRNDLDQNNPSWPTSIGSIEIPDGPNAADFDDWLKENWRPEDDWGRT